MPTVSRVPKLQKHSYLIQDKTDYSSSESEYETQSSRTGTEAGTASSNQERYAKFIIIINGFAIINIITLIVCVTIKSQEEVGISPSTTPL